MAAEASVALMHRITNVRLPGPLPGDGDQRYAVCLDSQGLICRIEAMGTEDQQTDENWNGDWLSPRGVDLQLNGGLGLAFPELTPADVPRLEELLELLWRDGVEAIAPTLVTCGIAPLRQALAVLREAREHHRPGRCRLLGAHLEGPFLAEARRGAHPREHLARPSLKALAERIGGFETEIALVTMAPELEGAAAVIQRLRELGINVALGHSAATAEQASAGFDQGVGMLTHAFNAMPGLHHRAPGPLGEACRRGGIAVGLIADGVHVHPTMALLLQRLAPEQTVLVSDALAPYGLADGEHRWDERVLVVENGTCRLEDGTLAGVTLPQLEGVKRLARWSDAPSAAIWSATVAPRIAIQTSRSCVDALLGRSIQDLLRWSIDQKTLSWRNAQLSP
ncbi:MULTISPECIES: N-acetylglucosamine-6-phosphate deacetylase [unclassified Synechococcus]|uniref:N-acetylglucosamine-6-phosphate deacetylase n=1 Tax=unclassified Synechococcus TaxID=2626047 RepID=UPI001CF8B275|nr:MULTISPECIES: N-acetylglucosamine-6-phosphate deacetylase [unclassified Synechococcus]MCB4376622.1 N-acetylglucosamine-6-phosphate deacetylase [Synechococcus sp. MU1650]MCB4411187.1 N-acetylglucosamine-6-phosphate deacetylase [Synechococcus sp. MU1611]